MTDQASLHVFSEAEILNFLAVGFLENGGFIEPTQQQIESIEHLIKTLVFEATGMAASH